MSAAASVSFLAGDRWFTYPDRVPYGWCDRNPADWCEQGYGTRGGRDGWDHDGAVPEARLRPLRSALAASPQLTLALTGETQ